MQTAPGKAGLVLAGGGARAAYQVGVLQALKEMLPDPAANPFPIIAGTSAGAVNAGALACHADDFGRAVDNLLDVWRNFEPRHVYRADFAGVAANSSRWIAGLLFGAFVRDRRTSLLDNRPLAALLGRKLEFGRIAGNIAKGSLDAVAVTCSGYTSGQSVSFFEGAPHIAGWKRSQRVGLRTRLGVEHLMASAAIPFLFPAWHVNREYFGDGSMRQIAPVSPALHLGADRVLVVGTGRQTADGARARSNIYPSLAQIAGHALNSIFLDSLMVDIERLERINRTVELIPPDALAANSIALRPIKVLFISPSQPIERIAARFLHELPRSVRFILRPTGAISRSGSNLASYLLFEEPFCRALIDLGYQDTASREKEVRDFFDGIAL